MKEKFKNEYSVGTRIKERREELKLSRNIVCERLGGVALSTLQLWEQNAREPQVSALIKLAEILDTTTDYLLHGTEDQKRTLITHEQAGLPKESNVTYKYDINLNNADEYELIDDYSDVQVSAGFGQLNGDYQAPSAVKVEKAWFISRRINPDDCVLLSVDGDSMHPTLQDGEKVIVDRSKQVLREGKIFVINHQGTMWVKKVRLKFDGIELLSDNPIYEPIKLTAQEADELIIIGQVVRSYRDF